MGLVLPAWLLGIHSFPSKPNRILGNGGFFYSGWPLNFGVGLPVTFAVLAWLSRAMVRSVDELTSGDRQVIETEPDAPPFWEALSAKLRASRRPLLWAVILVTVICTCVDNGDLWVGYVTGSFDRSRLEAWDAAAYNPEIRLAEPLSKFWTAIFNVVSLLGFQAGAIFLAFFFAFYFLLFFVYFSRLAFGGGAYRFRPMRFDLDRRLGLRPLSTVFNLFMVAALLYEVGVFLKRIELSINNGNTEPFVLWLTRVLKSPDSADAFSALFTLQRYQFDTLDYGAYLALLAMLIPIGIICYFPLSVYRNYLVGWRAATAAQMREYDNLVSEGRSREAKRLRVAIYAARKADVWPNGTANATTLFAAIGLLLLATWFPPVIAYGVVTGVLVFIAKLVWPTARA